jgi:hypothetical protein
MFSGRSGTALPKGTKRVAQALNHFFGSVAITDSGRCEHNEHGNAIHSSADLDDSAGISFIQIKLRFAI